MEIVILGSGTGIPRADRAPCSVLVRAAGRNVVLDLGPGVLRRLAEEGVDFRDLDAILLSHFHPDHTLDLWAFFFAAHWPGYTRPEPVRLLTPPGFDNLAGLLEQAYGHWVGPPEGRVMVHQAPQGSALSLELFPGLKLSHAPAAHKPESMAWRLEAEGRSVVYTGDTGPSAEVVHLARGADVLIADCAMPDTSPLPGHLTPGLAGQAAAQAGVKTLVLTHLYPETDGHDLAAAAAAEFSGRIIVAADGLTIHI